MRRVVVYRVESRTVVEVPDALALDEARALAIEMVEAGRVGEGYVVPSDCRFLTRIEGHKRLGSLEEVGRGGALAGPVHWWEGPVAALITIGVVAIVVLLGMAVGSLMRPKP